MANSVPRNPTALVSWAQRDPSWTHPEVADWRQQVTVFARALRSHGIDVKLDQWVQDPLVDWNRWGQRMVDECDFVIVAMNQRWADCWKGSHDPRTNAGVSREIDAISGRFDMSQREFYRRTLIALLGNNRPGVIPADLRRLHRYQIPTVDLAGLEDLILALTGTPAEPIPDLGKLPDYIASRGAIVVRSSSSAHDLAAEPRPVSNDRRPADAPNQIPRSQRAMVNRTREVKLINKRIQRQRARGATPVIVLAGGPGVGKSAIGRHWAMTHREEFGDGLLYAALDDFRRSDGTAVGEVLGHFLRGLGVAEDNMANGLAERADMFRARTRSHKVLVLLDDVRVPAEVTPLVPAGEGGAVIVTSRYTPRELLADGAELVEVQPLEEAHARLLLQFTVDKSRLAAEPDAVGKLIELCCGLPVALGICAGRLASRPRLSVQTFVDEVKQAVLRRLSRVDGERQTSVQACFDCLYRQLSDDDARVYRIIGLHAGLSFRAGAVAAAAGPEIDVHAVLDDLAGAHVIDDLAGGRFGMHQLLHEHARAAALHDLTDEEADSIVQRTVDHYLRACQHLDRALVAGRLRLAAGPPPGGIGASFEARREAFDWFESERANVVAAVRTAYERGWHEMVWTFGEALWPAYDYHHHLDEAVEVFTMATESARRCERDDAQARMQAQLARSLVERGEGEHAERLMLGAVELARTTDNANLRASVTEWLGWLHLRAGRFAQAIDCFTESRRMCHALGSGRGVALQDYLLGKAYAAVGRSALARDHLIAAAAHQSLVHDDLMRARIRLALGIVHVGDDDVNEGLRILDGVIDAAGELGAVDLEVAALIAAADAEASVANGAAQRAYLIRASDALTDPDDPRAIRVVARLARPPS